MSSVLRKVPFGSDYWHVVSDEHESIIGSLLYTPGRTLLPWRAEFTGALDRGWLQLKVGYFRTEEEGLDFLRDQLDEA